MHPQLISLLVLCSVLLLAYGLQQLRLSDQQLVVNRVKKLSTKDLKKKLRRVYQPEHQGLGRKLLTGASGLYIARRLGRLADKKLEEADILLRGEEFVVIVLAVTLGTGLLAATLTFNVLTGLWAGLLAGIVPFIILGRDRTKRLNNFNGQIGDALTIIANSIRSGFSFLQSMDMVRKELPDPISKEFGRTFREINLGTATEEALQNMAHRVNSEDLDLVVTAVLIQRQVGGNLAEILDNIAETIRERIRIKREIKTLTAQGRISGLIIGLLPVFVGVLMSLLNPAYIRELFTSKIGLLLLACAVAGEIVGILLIRKIVNIQV